MTPTPTGPTPTQTPATSPALVWVLKGTPIPALNNICFEAGQTYTQGDLFLQDLGSRFCTASGLGPVLTVAAPTPQTIGVYPSTTSSEVGIADIPPVSSAGTYDVVIQTFAQCTPGPPITIAMPAAIAFVTPTPPAP